MYSLGRISPNEFLGRLMSQPVGMTALPPIKQKKKKKLNVNYQIQIPHPTTNEHLHFYFFRIKIKNFIFVDLAYALFI